jgi:hypothetical protein
MTAESLQQSDLIATIDEKATSEQKLLNRIRDLEDEVRRLKPYEYFCEVQSRYITSIGRHDDLHTFIKKEQRETKSARRAKNQFYVVGD